MTTLMKEVNLKAKISISVTPMIQTLTLKVEIKKKVTCSALLDLLVDQLCLQAGHKLIGVKHPHQASFLLSEAKLMLIKMT
jgi:hypothetical protein